MQQRQHQAQLAVAFLASDVNRFSINALTGAIEQDEILPITLVFPHPRDAQAEIARLMATAETVVVAFSFMSSALLSTRQALEHLQAFFAEVRERILFVAGGPHASGDAAGTLAMGFDVVFIGEGERSFPAFLHRLAEPRRDFSDVPGLAFLEREERKAPRGAHRPSRADSARRALPEHWGAPPASGGHRDWPWLPPRLRFLPNSLFARRAYALPAAGQCALAYRAPG